MPNRNYINGRRKEYKVVHAFKDKGFTALRSAGSHSPIDVVAINPDTKKIVLIQCKPKSMSENKKKEIEEKNKKLNGLFEVEFLVD
jgi:Holliday junction resolvase